MANAFNKEETVAFEQILEGFEDNLVMSENVSVYNTNSTQMERSGDTIWRPQPYIALSYDGTDQTANFQNFTQLSVPATLGFRKSVPWTMTINELRDMMQMNRMKEAASQRLATDVNKAVMDVVAAQGSIVVKRTAAASGYADVSEIDSVFNEQGIQSFDRYLALSSRNYNSMADNLAARQTMNDMVSKAYRKAYVGEVAGFETFKLDTANRLTAATATTVTINGANQYYTPKATTTAATNEVGNVDNRFQTISITVGGSTVKVGDCFTVANVYSVHHITKQATAQLKTFRIVAIVTGAGGTGTVQITPPFISGGGGTDAELQYQNISATPANGAALVFLNTVTADVNPFWVKGSIELLPGHNPVPTDAGGAVLRGTTENGIEVMFQKFYDINTMLTKYRTDIFFGVVNLNPEMNGIELFSQT